MMRQNISTTTGSKDLQMVSITLRVLSRPEVDHLSKIYQNLGLDYDERVLPSIGNEVLKATVAQFDAAELITQREVVSFCAMPAIKTLLSSIVPYRFHQGLERISFSVQGSSTSD
jgi:regulator of protease activity HflC (stomatin/prohibitin superfamily)